MQEVKWSEERTEELETLLKRLRGAIGDRGDWLIVDASSWSDEEFTAAVRSDRGHEHPHVTWYVRAKGATLTHHVIADGWTIAPLLREVLTLLDAMKRA